MDDYISREAAIMVAMDYDGQGNAQDASQDIASGLVELPAANVRPVKEGEWIVRQRYEHYPSCRPYEELICPFCKRTDHNGDGRFCGYCGAKMGGEPNG